MKSYFIFIIVLTVVYAIYYAVIIVQDLYGKKGTDKPKEEVFDLGDPEEEQSVTVTESDTGFHVGDEQYETEVVSAVMPAPQETERAGGTGEAAMEEKLERLKARMEEQMEETTPYLSDAFTDEELYRAMRQPSGTGMETFKRPIVACRELEKYCVCCA